MARVAIVIPIVSATANATQFHARAEFSVCGNRTTANKQHQRMTIGAPRNRGST